MARSDGYRLASRSGLSNHESPARSHNPTISWPTGLAQEGQNGVEGLDHESAQPVRGYRLRSQTGTLFDAAGFDKLIKPGDLVAIKIHCGEWNNTAYLRPVYARTIVDKIKELGGRPFVTDTCTMTYSPYSSRSIGPDLMATAERNGFNSGTLGVPFLPADGFAGTDDVRIPLPEGYILQEAFIAKAIALADVLIVLTHFKGHPMGVIGGSIKNLGIGCQSKRGKFNVHMGRHPEYGFGNQVTFHPENVPQDFLEIIPDACPTGPTLAATEPLNGTPRSATVASAALGRWSLPAPGNSAAKTSARSTPPAPTAPWPSTRPSTGKSAI